MRSTKALRSARAVRGAAGSLAEPAVDVGGRQRQARQGDDHVQRARAARSPSGPCRGPWRAAGRATGRTARRNRPRRRPRSAGARADRARTAARRRSSAAAASELPPPRPAAAGTRLAMLRLTSKVRSRRRSSSRTTLAARLSSPGATAHSTARPAPAGAGLAVTRSASVTGSIGEKISRNPSERRGPTSRPRLILAGAATSTTASGAGVRPGTRRARRSRAVRAARHVGARAAASLRSRRRQPPELPGEGDEDRRRELFGPGRVGQAQRRERARTSWRDSAAAPGAAAPAPPRPTASSRSACAAGRTRCAPAYRARRPRRPAPGGCA